LKAGDRADDDLNATSAEVTGRITAKGSGWMLVRARREEGDEDVLDIHPYATTRPIYDTVGRHPRRSRAAATWALQWLDRLEKATLGKQDYRTRDEREAVLREISRAKASMKPAPTEARTRADDGRHGLHRRRRSANSEQRVASRVGR